MAAQLAASVLAVHLCQVTIVVEVPKLAPFQSKVVKHLRGGGFRCGDDDDGDGGGRTIIEDGPTVSFGWSNHARRKKSPGLLVVRKSW